MSIKVMIHNLNFLQRRLGVSLLLFSLLCSFLQLMDGFSTLSNVLADICNLLCKCKEKQLKH